MPHFSECRLAQAQGEQVYRCGGFDDLVVGDQGNAVRQPIFLCCGCKHRYENTSVSKIAAGMTLATTEFSREPNQFQ